MTAAKLISSFVVIFLAASSVQARTVIIDGVVADAERNREIPYRLYVPGGQGGAYPVLIYSSGMGGSMRDAAYLGSFLAAHGYVSMHLEHPGTGADIWRRGHPTVIDAIRTAGADEQAAKSRFGDIRVAVSYLHKMNSEGSLKGVLDLDRLGLSGHSYGALTVFAALGVGVGFDANFAVPGVRAALVLSPNLPGTSEAIERSTKPITTPIFHVTGMLDESPVVAGLGVFQRIIPYRSIAAGDQYLLILRSADHMAFAGISEPFRRAQSRDAEIHKKVRSYVLRFWDAHLKGKRTACDWLRRKLRKRTSDVETFEWRNPETCATNR